MKKLALTNYYNFTKKENDDHICPHCSRKIKKWALSQCSSCNRFFCRSHMEPSIGQNKKCPGCRKHQQDFVKSEPVFSAIKSAESKLNEFRLAESEDLEHAIFASIFGNKNLIRFAEEEQNLESVSEEPQTETPQTEINQPEDPEQNADFIESSVDVMANEIAKALQSAGLSPSSEDAAQLINAVFSNSNFENVKIAQTSNSNAEQAFKNNPAVGMTESIAMQPQYHPADLGPYGQLTPQEARALESIYDNYVSLYGRAFFERLPQTSNENIMENRRRMVIFSNYLADVTKITNDQNKIFSFYQKMGIRPDIPMATYR